MILENQKVKIGDWIVADRCIWWNEFYILPGARLKVMNIPLNNNGRVRLCLNISEYIQILPEFNVHDIKRDFSFSGKEPEGIPRLRNRYDIAKGVSEPLEIKSDNTSVPESVIRRDVQLSDVIRVIEAKMVVNDITKDSRLVEDLNADSLDLVELILTFEDEYEINIPDEEVEYIKTVNDVYEYLVSKSLEI
jgi:acyl carrier protein